MMLASLARKVVLFHSSYYKVRPPYMLKSELALFIYKHYFLSTTKAIPATTGGTRPDKFVSRPTPFVDTILDDSAPIRAALLRKQQ